MMVKLVYLFKLLGKCVDGDDIKPSSNKDCVGMEKLLEMGVLLVGGCLGGEYLLKFHQEKKRKNGILT